MTATAADRQRLRLLRRPARAMREMLAGGELDVLTGDYLAELTMLILGRDRLKDAALGYAKTFLRQLEDCLGDGARARRAGSSQRRRPQPGRAGRRGPRARRPARPRRRGRRTSRATTCARGPASSASASRSPPTPTSARWGIAECLRAGADVVVTGRVTDASLVVGPAAAHFGWAPHDYDALAGAVVAGHVIECGTQATGGNYSLLHRARATPTPLGFPIAEVARRRLVGDHQAPRHRRRGHRRHRHRAAALRDRRRRATPAPTSPPASTPSSSTEDGPDRVRISGVRGEPPPPTLKVGLNALGGFRNEVTFVLTGLDIEAKAALVQAQLAGRRRSTWWTLARTDHPDADAQEEAAALLHCVVRGTDPKAVGRAFSGAAIELALASYPGFHVTAPPGDAVAVRRVHRRLRRRRRWCRTSRCSPTARRVDIAPADATAGRSTTSPSPWCPTGATHRPDPARAARHGRRRPQRRQGRRGQRRRVGAQRRRRARWLAQHARPSTSSRSCCPRPRRCAVDAARAAQPARAELRRRGPARRGRRLQRPARPAGQGARRVAALAPRRHPGGAAVTDPVRRPPERRALRETVRRFVEREVLPHQDEWERAGELPRSLHRAAARARADRPGYPEAVGGGGGDAVDALVLAEEFHYAGGAGGVFATLFTSGISLPHLVARRRRRRRSTAGCARRSTGELIGSLAITEPDGGSDVAGIRTTAKRDGDDYVVNGAKTYITSGVRADFVVTAVRTGDAGRARPLAARGREGHARLHRLAPARQDGLALLRHRRAVLRRRARAGGEPGRRRRTPASPRSRRTSSANGSAWPCRPTPARSAASTSPWSGAASARRSAGR